MVIINTAEALMITGQVEIVDDIGMKKVHLYKFKDSGMLPPYPCEAWQN
jgi:hypothetical protein